MKTVIVGAVAGGASLAARLRRNLETEEIVVLERGEYISYANCGLPYYIGGEITNKQDLLLQTPQGFAKRFALDMRVMHEVISVLPDRDAVVVREVSTGREYQEEFDRLVLSPGARPIRPPIEGAEEPWVFTLRNVPDTLRIDDYIRENDIHAAAVIGGGFIGLEMAENLRARGLAVTVIEALDHVMAGIDVDIAHDLHNHIRENQVALHLSRRATKISQDGVELDDGSFVAAQMVILAVGVAPDTAFLQGSGIELDQRGGIITDEMLRTSRKNVYALGDAAVVKGLMGGFSRVPLASPANKQARVIADQFAGGTRPYRGALGTAVAKVFGMTVATVGESESVLRAAGKPYLKVLTHSPSHATYYPGATMMTVKLICAPETGAVLGAQIVGGDGVDKRIDHLAQAITGSMTAFDLVETEFAYAPPFSSAKDPVNLAAAAMVNILEGRSRLFFLEDLPQVEGKQFIDVRTPEEFARGAIPGSKNIPLDELRARLGELKREETLYVTCQVGQRGYLAQRILMQHGFDTYNLSGGYRLYEAAVRDAQKASQGIPSRPCPMPR